jgi:hypothetical protein
MIHRSTTRAWCLALAFSTGFAGLPAAAQSTTAAALITTEALAAAGAQSPAHARLAAALDRQDLQAALGARGLDADQARKRVAALTDAEAAALAAHIDRAPAGAESLLSALVFIFVLLLVTDILGLTKVFPFTRSVR